MKPKISRSEIGGLIVIMGCALIIFASWLAWGKIGLISTIGVFLIVQGIGAILRSREDQAKSSFEETHARLIAQQKAREELRSRQ